MNQYYGDSIYAFCLFVSVLVTVTVLMIQQSALFLNKLHLNLESKEAIFYHFPANVYLRNWEVID